MKTIFDARIELQAMHDAGSATAFDESLLDLLDSSPTRVGGINAQVTQDIVVLGV